MSEHPAEIQTRDAWVKPEILSYDAVEATEANTFNPGDILSSNS